jgi:predicted nucleic acid-binding protein
VVKPIVIDASVAASWLLDDESDARAEAALAAIADTPSLVPQSWHYQMRNTLLVAWRRGRISADGLHGRVAVLADLPVETDADPDLDVALRLASAHGLSFYDALYLELACRRQAVVASLDSTLLKAARAEGVAADEGA